MAQDPFLIDQIQIEPGSGQTLLVSRDAATGALRLQDAVTTGGILLHQLAGLRAIGNVYVVGKTGTGAEYTTIQSALDAVPSAASSANPYIVLVMPGIYTETVNIARDGVRLVGLGNPLIRSALELTPDAGGADHTLIISAQLGTIPLSTLIEGFTITNVHTNKACVRVLGAAASTVASVGVVLRNCDLQANGAGGNRNVWATACNNITFEGGRWSEAANLGLLLIEEVSGLWISGVTGMGAISLRYDTTEDEPSLGANVFSITDCGTVAGATLLATPAAIDLAGGGDLVVIGTVFGGQTNLSGDQSMSLRGCVVPVLNLLETVTVTAENSLIQSILAANATAELDLPKLRGTATLAAAATIAVAFDIPMSDADYQVDLELPSRPVNDETPWVTAKAVTGFTINFQTAQTMTCLWQATRSNV
jgi:hypothetical protein